MEGTVTDILGNPATFLIIEARIPATSAPINAAAAGGIFARSTISRRRVLATAPIHPAVAASFLGLLNITENPKTPQKLAAVGREFVPGLANLMLENPPVAILRQVP